MLIIPNEIPNWFRELYFQREQIKVNERIRGFVEGIYVNSPPHHYSIDTIIGILESTFLRSGELKIRLPLGVMRNAIFIKVEDIILTTEGSIFQGQAEIEFSMSLDLHTGFIYAGDVKSSHTRASYTDTIINALNLKALMEQIDSSDFLYKLKAEINSSDSRAEEALYTRWIRFNKKLLTDEI
jgi:hypothetical protein